MKTFFFLVNLLALTACDRTWRSKAEPTSKSSKEASDQLDQWSGRSDDIDTRWQVKNQP